MNIVMNRVVLIGVVSMCSVLFQWDGEHSVEDADDR
jgi:hypothetical protein